MSSDAAAAQLRRILHLVPLLADGEAHPLDELAALEGIDERALNRLLIALASRGDDPAGFVEGVQIYLENGCVSLFTSHFLRPMRLTIAELAALDLGLAMLRGELPAAEHGSIDEARARMRDLMAATGREDAGGAGLHAEVGAAGDAAHLAALRAARAARRRVRMDYRKPDSDATEARVVHPYALVAVRGAWYMAAHCERAASLRIFRLDRVHDVTPLEERYELPPGFSLDDVLAGGVAFIAAAPEPLRVRYSPRIARWIAERHDGVEEGDGSFVVEHHMADSAWAVRHVLQYGPDAEVLSPPAVREEMVRRLASLLPAR